ncbi:MAG TPA: cupredoxin domain-containing protein [Acidimicrobiales bacterium]|nr:cupredoxin domain-containing protein [Acidimicrobiales bacterium]
MHDRDALRIRVRCGRLALLPLAALGTTAALAAAAIATGPAGAAATKTTTVTATETDFHIALSKKTFTAGRYTFLAKNRGQTTHALEITGPGLSHATTKNFGPGQSAKLTVTLKKGAYDVFCPVPGHKQLGMNVNISVGVTVPAAAGAGTAGTGTTPTTSSAGAGGAAF